MSYEIASREPRGRPARPAGRAEPPEPGRACDLREAEPPRGSSASRPPRRSRPLVGYEPARLEAAGQASHRRDRAPGATADAVIVLWMAGGMASTETFDPKRYTAVRAGRADQGRAEHVSDHRHQRGPHQVHAGARADRERHGQRLDHPHLHGRGPRVHPALAPPVPLAHGLHPLRSRRRCRISGRSSRARSARRTPTCRRSSRSARRSKAPGRSAR